MLQHRASLDLNRPGQTQNIGSTWQDEPPSVRQEIAELVRVDQLVKARQLAQNALRNYPGHEDILVIHALVCEMQQDWEEAEKSLRRLVEIQSPKVTQEVWRHLIRVLHCAGQNQQAVSAAYTAMQQHPGSIILRNELEELRVLKAPNSATV